MINVDDRLIRNDLKIIGVDAFAILMCITSHLGKSSTAWPGVSRLREMTGLSKARTYAAIKTLIDSRMVERWQENDNGTWGMVIYRVTTNYLAIYMNAATFTLSEPLAGNAEHGNAEHGKPESGNTEHISVKEKEVLSNIEVIKEEEERRAPENTNFYHPEKYKQTADYLISYLNRSENKMWLNDMPGNWTRAVKGYCMKLQKNEQWNKLQVPKDEGDHYRWFGSMLAGIKSWYKTAEEFDKQSGRTPDAVTIKAPAPPNLSKTTRRASADEARKIAGL